jgi:hypothetical protein
MKDLISMIVTAEQKATVLAALKQIEASLPNMVSLEPDERKSVLRMRAKNGDFARTTLRIAAQNPTLIPPSIDIAAAVEDLAALDQLIEIHELLTRLYERVTDTVAALGHDVMVTAHDSYNVLKVTGKAQGLDELTDGVSTRFAKKKRKPAAPPPAGEGGGA